jgi:hypothetical protein
LKDGHGNSIWNETLVITNNEISMLRGKNSRFCILIASVIKDIEGKGNTGRPFMPQSTQTCSSTSKPPVDQIVQRLKSYSVVQNVSTKLYEALEKVCKEHDKHLAHFRIEPHHVKIIDGELPRVQFEMRFAQECSHSRTRNESMSVAWLAVESIICDLPLRGSPVLQPLSTSLIASDSFSKNVGKRKRTNSFILNSLDDKRVRSSQIQSSDDDSGYETLPLTPEPNPATTQPHLAYDKPDFCLRQDFCFRFQAYSQGMTENPNRFIGYLDKLSPRMHMVYFSPLSITWAQQEPISLAETFTTLFRAQNLMSTMPYERVELAKQLASTMLQFQGTPLLNASWGSRNVVLFGRVGKCARVRELLKNPYLDVCICKDQERASVTSSPCELFVYNQYLLSLAVVLVEIAYQQPLLDLREDNDLENWPPNEDENAHSMWLVADRLCQSISAKLGQRYKSVVRKCLDACVEENAQYLGDEKFQAMIYTDVVHELEELKQWMIDENGKVDH